MRRLMLAAMATAILVSAGVASGQVLQRNFQRTSLRRARGGRAGPQAFTGAVTAAKIRAAIDQAVMFLRSQQRDDGSIERGHARGGGTALAALTMLAAGVSPESDAHLRKALEWLAGQDTDNTYVRGIRANTWEYALRKVPTTRQSRPH